MPKSPTKFFNEVKAELKQVTWPTKQETIRLTVIVIVICLAIGAYIGLLDLILTKLIQIFIKI